jgi:hypothetical protein
MVESGSQLMCDFPGEQGELNGWLTDFRGFCNEADGVRIRIFLELSRVWLSIEKDLNLSLKVLDVLICPFNLSERSS